MLGTPGTGNPKTREESAVSWVLRELRPVSFRIKFMSESKQLATEQLRYGFVAQEVERVAPNLVVKSEGSGGDGKLSLIYKDLLAVLTLAFQEQQQALKR